MDWYFRGPNIRLIIYQEITIKSGKTGSGWSKKECSRKRKITENKNTKGKTIKFNQHQHLMTSYKDQMSLYQARQENIFYWSNNLSNRKWLHASAWPYFILCKFPLVQIAMKFSRDEERLLFYKSGSELAKMGAARLKKTPSDPLSSNWIRNPRCSNPSIDITWRNSTYVNKPRQNKS